MILYDGNIASRFVFKSHEFMIFKYNGLNCLLFVVSNEGRFCLETRHHSSSNKLESNALWS